MAVGTGRGVRDVEGAGDGPPVCAVVNTGEDDAPGPQPARIAITSTSAIALRGRRDGSDDGDDIDEGRS
ncbi:MAG TPA: hypothetical protein VFW02_02175, partial [Candidatus Limnocylindrales bacterium]|nr:hypothetical protein [Candidatus Limnocylindrales bacterium]